ncbi:hypothetical protein CWE15_11740 [Aliidiomarina taiwanensis]|uniref:Insecticide toxin TcdB middle/N-terminal domain-containing protein n=1 Tax=Aliidiomarina taiwanensis TaxID=946228 RepID=A0A432WTH6_9GAMM|nr:VCBS repeat-containing protein [Aliidiomarina taiwanensis]RUO37073.1 hypothetical protein CWE15_11740 [Aliidiomarina taiwanensis]
MRRLLLGSILLFLSSISGAFASTWTPYMDESGDLFLRLSPAVIAEPNGEVMSVYRPGSFIRVEFMNGEWVAIPMNQRQWRSRRLTQGHDDLVHLSYEAIGPNGEKRLVILMERDGVQYHLRFSSVGRNLAMRSVNLDDEPPYQPRFRTLSNGGSSLLTPSDHEATTANFRVDESGAATIEVPIYTPEGIAGVTPQLAFSYNSRGGDGQLGLGWSLSAVGAVTRCPQTVVHDGVANGVTFSNRDRLCLNGERLLGSNSSNYWGSSYFVPELSPSTRVHPYRVSGQIRAFVVETKAGELHYFGDLNAITSTRAIPTSVPFSARNDALFYTHPTLVSAVKNVPKMWAQKSTADIMGNYIEYTYTNFVNTGEHYLTGVRYTLRANNQQPLHHVVLEMGSRSTKTGWQYGTPLQSSRRIESVRVSSHGHLVRRYRLDYRVQNLPEDNLYLDGIQECSVHNGLERCKYPVTFDWQRPASASLDPIVICDHYSPHICWEEPQQNDWGVFDTQTSYGAPSVNPNTQLIMDFTRNGHADFVYVENGQWRIRLGGLSPSPCAESPEVAGACYPEGSIGGYVQSESLGSVGANAPSRALTIDYDGSGRRALLVASNEERIWRILGMRANEPDDGCELDYGAGFCGYLSQGFQKLSVNTHLPAKGLGARAKVADVNGDGFEDIIFIENNRIYAYMNLGMNGAQHQGFSEQVLVAVLEQEPRVPPPIDGQALPPASHSSLANSVFFDMNGNGYTDILLQTTYYECLDSSPNTDECFGKYIPRDKHDLYLYNPDTQQYTFKMPLGEKKNIRIGDLNGDGLSDLVYNNGHGWFYRLSNGQRFESGKSLSVPDIAGARSLLQLVDLDGDGKSEIFVPESGGVWGIYVTATPLYSSTLALTKRATISRQSGVPYRFADLNGDGLPELVYADNQNYWRVRKNNLGTPARNAITEFTVDTLIKHKPVYVSH